MLRSSESSRVTFQWVFDSKGVVSDVGGLLAMFLITMKIASSGALTSLNWTIRKCSQRKHERREEEGNTKKAVDCF